MSAETRVPTRLGPYRLLESLGAGAMGEVFLAEDEGERRVALKVLHPHLLRRRNFFRRFQREAHAGEAVDHPNVVRTHDAAFYVVDGVTWCVIATEYVEGRTLRDLLDDLGRIPEPMLREIAHRMASGLEAIHDAGIVHRDLKPENVLITPDHEIRIMDLGVARLLDRDLGLTGEGQFIGSLPYAAPEQLQSDEVGPWTDLYALGVLLHELASGENPFVRDDPVAVLQAHLAESPPDLAAGLPDFSPWFAGLIRALLSKDPARRPRNAREVGDALRLGAGSAWWKAWRATRGREDGRVPRVPVARETRMHGRAAELAALRAAWTKARAGEGTALLIEGEAGIGKSRLVDALLGDADRGDARVLYGAWSPSGETDAVFDGLRDAIDDDDLAAVLRSRMGPYGSLAEPLAARIHREPRSPDAPELDRNAIATALVALMCGLCTERPLLWVVEDLHFAGPDDRRLVIALARGLVERNVLLVLTTRPGVEPATLSALTTLPTVRKVDLPRLEGAAIDRVVRERFRDPTQGERWARSIVDRVDGNPWFALEVVRALESEGRPRPVSPAVAASSPTPLPPVPESLRDLIASRLHALEEAGRELLEAASVLGYVFDPYALAAVLERDALDLLKDLARLERRTGLVRSVESRLRFDHHLLQEVVYGGVAPPLRQALHLRAAEALEARSKHDSPEGAASERADAPALCEHYLRAGRPDLAWNRLGTAIDVLEDQDGDARAAVLLEEVLSWVQSPQDRQRCSFLLRLARFQYGAAPDFGLAAAEEAVALAKRLGEPRVRTQAESYVLTCLVNLRRFDEVRSGCAAMLARCREIADDHAEGVASYHQAELYLCEGQPREALEWCHRALALLSDAENADVGRGRGFLARHWVDVLVARCLDRLGRGAEARERYLQIPRTRHSYALVQNALGGIEQQRQDHRAALMYFARARDEYTKRGIHDGRILSILNLSNALGALEEYVRARDALDDALASIRTYMAGRRAFWFEAAAARNLALLHQSMGDLRAALACNRRLIQRAEQAGDQGEVAAGYANSASILLALGDHDAAQEHWAKGLALARACEHVVYQRIMTENMAILALERGRLAETRRRLEGLEALMEPGAKPHSSRAAGVDAMLWHALGQVDRALASTDVMMALSREEGEGHNLACAIIERALLAIECGQDTEASRFAKDGAQALHEDGRNLTGRSDELVNAGEALMQAGERREAQELLLEALALARKLELPRPRARSLARLALLDPAYLEEATAAVEGSGEAGNTIDARYYLWKATGEHEHLAEAKRLLDERVEHAPEEYRESMIENVRLNREIMQEWARVQGEEGAPPAS